MFPLTSFKPLYPKNKIKYSHTLFGTFFHFHIYVVMKTIFVGVVAVDKSKDQKVRVLCGRHLRSLKFF